MNKSKKVVYVTQPDEIDKPLSLLQESKAFWRNYERLRGVTAYSYMDAN